MFGRNKHVHEWVEVSRTWNPSTYILKRIKGDMSYETQKLIFGFTVVELKCATCGDIKHETVIGKADG